MTTTTDGHSPLAPFGNRLFLGYWLTGLSANFGWLIQLVGASWLMTSIGGSPELVALVQTSISVPVFLFAVPAGAMADSFGRKTMVIWSQSFLLSISVALAIFSYMGLVTPTVLLVFTFLIGSGKALNNPGWQTLVSEFMPREQLPAAIALNSMGFNIARSVGPAIGGLIVASVGAFATFVVNAVSNIGMIVVLARWRGEPVRRELPPEPIGDAVMAGIRFIAMSPDILTVLLRASIFNFAAISVMALMPLIARDLIKGGPETYGFLLGAFGIGAIIGVLVNGRMRSALSIESIARVGFVMFAFATVLVASSNGVVMASFGAAVAGISWLLTLSALNTSVQMSSPRWVVSRCQGIYQAACFGGNAAGSWLWGYLASDFGTGMSLLMSAIALMAGVAIGFLFPLKEFGTISLEPHLGWTPPQPVLDLVPQSGPILTTIEYDIREEDSAEFVAVMRQRRRSRTRDGTRYWSLSRDIENPSIWTERYETATWVDLLRHHQRRTKVDAELGEWIRALHSGPEKPRVRYHLDDQTGRRGGDMNHLPREFET